MSSCFAPVQHPLKTQVANDLINCDSLAQLQVLTLHLTGYRDSEGVQKALTHMCPDVADL
jgi:hypothetical protein